MAGARPGFRGSLLWWSLPLFKVSGISIRVHPTFALLLAYAAWIGFRTDPGGWGAAGLMLLLVCLIFVCVCLHELGHSLVAQRYGVEVQSITLLPIGGVAALKRIPEDPRKEIAITVAGPLVNLVIAAALALWLGMTTLADFKLFSTAQFQDPLFFLLQVNVLMFLFNLVPAFPMDGGRLLRALLAFKLPYARATTIAATVGQVVAALFIVVGLLTPPAFLLAIVGLFIMFAAGNEERIVKTRASLAQVTAGQIMRRVFESVSPEDTVSSVLPKIFHNEQDMFPVVDGGRLEGFVTRPLLLRAMRNGGGQTPVTHIMDRNVFAVGPHESGASVFEHAMSAAVPAIPVVEDGRVVGLVSLETLNRCVSAGDVLRAISKPSVPPSDRRA